MAEKKAGKEHKHAEKEEKKIKPAAAHAAKKEHAEKEADMAHEKKEGKGHVEKKGAEEKKAEHEVEKTHEDKKVEAEEKKRTEEKSEKHVGKKAAEKAEAEAGAKAKKEPKKKPEKIPAFRPRRNKAIRKLQKLIARKQRVKFRGRFGKRNRVRNISKEKWQKWRKPRGIDIRFRLEDGPVPGIGYGANAKIKGLHPSGYAEFMARNMRELEKAAKMKDVAVRFAAGIGRKKRNEMLKKAYELKVFVVNK